MNPETNQQTSSELRDEDRDDDGRKATAETEDRSDGVGGDQGAAQGGQKDTLRQAYRQGQDWHLQGTKWERSSEVRDTQLLYLNSKSTCYENHEKNEYFPQFLVMSLVGKSLEDLRRQVLCKNFSKSTAMKTSLQALEAISDLHSVGFLHRDVK